MNTPTPWFCGTFREIGSAPGIDIGAENGSNIALVYHDESDREPLETKANAALIVRAVNSHQALVDALNKFMERDREDGLYGPIYFDAEAALKLARRVA